MSLAVLLTFGQMSIPFYTLFNAKITYFRNW